MAVHWRDTAERFGLISRALHWGMAGLFLWQFTGMGLRLALGRTPLVSFWVGTHAPLGALLLVLVLIRLGWARANRHNRPPHDPGRLGQLARLGHGGLYTLMLAVPALGLLRLYGSGRGFAPFGLTIFPPRAEKITWMIAPADALHSPLAWGLLALIAGHVAMALIHHVLWRDGLVLRMAGRMK